MPIGIDTYGKAMAAYAKAAAGDGAHGAAGGAGGAAGGASFGDMLQKVVEDGVSSGKAAEQASIAAVGGKGGAGTDLGHVVTAVAEAEVSLQTVVAVRERVIEAYKEILRMPM